MRDVSCSVIPLLDKTVFELFLVDFWRQRGSSYQPIDRSLKSTLSGNWRDKCFTLLTLSLVLSINGKGQYDSS